jgi:hypothetical protein
MDQISRDRKIDPGKARKMVGEISQVTEWPAWKALTGKTSIPQNTTLGAVGQFIRTWESVSKLMGAVISAAPTDPMMQIVNQRFQGKPLLKAFADVYGNYFKGRGSGESRYHAYVNAEGFDGLIDAALSRYSDLDGPVGFMSHMATMAFKIQGLTGFTDWGRAAGARCFSVDMGSHAVHSFDELPLLAALPRCQQPACPSAANRRDQVATYARLCYLSLLPTLPFAASLHHPSSRAKFPNKRASG